MPESRKRPGHPYHKQADIPARQRVKGRVIWAILLGVFGLLIALFATGNNYVVLATATLFSAIVGYIIGQRMEKDVIHKP
jgi:lipopolysaccharide export LptBFGC system permease protein LptF